MPDDLHSDDGRPGPNRFAPSYRVAQSSGLDAGAKRLLLIAGGLVILLLALMGGWSMLGRRSGSVPVIEADGRPLRIKPENPGGMQVAGADDQVMGDRAGQKEAMAPAAERPAPQALRAQLQPSHAPEPQASVPPAPVPAPLLAPAPAPVAAAPTTPAPARAVPPIEGVFVQLAAVGNEQAAQKQWHTLSKRMPGLLASHRPVVLRAEHDGHVIWRLRTGGFADVADATSFCARVRTKGAGCTLASF